MTITEIADAATATTATTATASWEVIADGLTETFVSESVTDGYTSTWTQVAVSHPPAPHRASTQGAVASTSSVGSYEAFLVTQSDKLGPHTMIPIFMPTQPGIDNDDIITALGSANGTTTWNAAAIHSVWDRYTAPRSASASTVAVIVIVETPGCDGLRLTIALRFLFEPLRETVFREYSVSVTFTSARSGPSVYLILNRDERF